MMLTLPPKNNVSDFPIADHDAEQAMVAGMLQSSRIADSVLAVVSPASVRLPVARAIVEAIDELRANNAPIDTTLIWRTLRNRQSTISLAELTEIAKSGQYATPESTLYHARRVAEMAQLQALAEAGDAMLRLAYSGQRADDALGKAQALLQGCAGSFSNARVLTLGESVSSVWEKLRSGTPSGIPTGFRDIDQLTGGWHATDLNLLAARPGCGKTALALNLIEQVAVKGVPVFFSSLEMGHEQLAGRMLANASKVNGQAIRLHAVSAGEMDRVYAAVERLAELPITIYDKAAVTTGDLRSRIQVWRAQNPGAAFVAVDYLQLMKGQDRSRDGRVQEIGEISAALKAIAKDFDVPVLALAQLSRAVEGRTGHIPMLSDLRESGSLEQDADMVMFIHREEMYDADTDKKGIAELHIAKHRNGPVGIIPLRFSPETTTFETLSYRSPEGY